MRIAIRRAIRSTAVLVTLGCDTPTDPLQVSAGMGSLTLANRTEQAIYYVLLESETATLIDWYPCTNPTTCRHVPALDEKTVPYEEVYGYEPGDREAVLYWWHLEIAPTDGFQPDSIRAMRFRLWPVR